MIDHVQVWVVIVLLGLGSFLIRFSFIGLIGDRPLPGWVLRHLRYTAVAILPALVAPVVAFPAATGGAFDWPRGLAALVTVIAGLWWRNTLAAILAGAVTLYAALYVSGGMGI